MKKKQEDEWSRDDEGRVLLNGKPYIPPLVRKVMKSAGERELEEATENLRRYLNELYKMFLKIEGEGEPPPEEERRIGFL
jgi:hypothetical protein